LSLGLESAGFDLFFANELSPMAAETFAYNILNEDLEEIAKDRGTADKTIWINSKFERHDLEARLRENPQILPVKGNGYSDLGATTASLEKKLLVGSIIELNSFLKAEPKLALEIRKIDLDLVSGGPPCQSFSLAGLRQHDNKRNSLPMDFADFVGHTKPKIAMLENVSGILREFRLTDGSKHYAWFEVARAFSDKGYVPLCLHVNAKNTGAAQNRPRFIMIAFRIDIFDALRKSRIGQPLKNALDCSLSFHQKENLFRKGKGPVPLPNIDLAYYDLEKNPAIYDDPILKSLNDYRTKSDWRTAKEAIDDLRKRAYSPSSYSKFLDAKLKPPHRIAIPDSYESLRNHIFRANGNRVKKRFRLYQIISKAPKDIAKDVIAFLRKPEEHKMESETYEFLLKKKYLANDSKSLLEFAKKEELRKYLAPLSTKKQTQKALVGNEPAPAALSIPDDACHYNANEMRTLTVREMARFQSFPDWFVFRSKETTGGQKRKFQVPQYTQVGNAVPPLLGLALGKVISKLLKKYESHAALANSR